MPAIRLRRLADLTPVPTNARVHSDSQVDQICDSIRTFGWTVPILIDEDDEIIAGHGRFLAAARMDLERVPTIRLDHLTPDQVRAYRLADNRLTELGEWDTDLLAGELQALKASDFDLGPTGFNLEDLGRLLPVDDAEDVDAGGPVPDPVTKPGDVWLLGRHRLGCGDSTDPATVDAVLQYCEPSLMVTDPPYGVGYDATWRVRSGLNQPTAAAGKVSNDDRSDWREAYALAPGPVAYVWMGGLSFPIAAEGLVACGFELRSTIIWVKNQLVIGRGHYHWQHEPCWYAVRKGAQARWTGDRKQATVWAIDKPRKSDTDHSTQKPVECMARPIANHQGDVYDPFVGSGTTILAAERLDRTCFAIEVNPGYVDVAIRRWQQQTGRVARLEATGAPFVAD